MVDTNAWCMGYEDSSRMCFCGFVVIEYVFEDVYNMIGFLRKK